MVLIRSVEKARRIFVLRYFFLTLCLLCQPCFAADWQSQSSNSRLSYTVNFEKQPISGLFEQFQVLYKSTSDAAPQQLTVVVDVASVNMGGSDINEAIRQSEWFDISHYPKAMFTSSDFGKGQDGSLIANGKIQIKGITKPLMVPFYWEPVVGQSRTMMMTGKVALNRLDFLIGTGEWASGDEVGLGVTVDFKITLILASKELEP